MVITTRVNIDGEEARVSTAIAIDLARALMNNIHFDYEPHFDEHQDQLFVFKPDEAEQYYKEKAEGLYDNIHEEDEEGE